MLRWHLQLGLTAVPKSGLRNPQRMRDNLAVFDFALSEPDELASLDALDEGRAPARDPETHGH